MVKPPLVSIIVPSYTMRRLGDILVLLRSVQDQTHPNIETIVVVERSVMLFDRIKEYARKNGGRKVKIVFSEEPGATSARNKGIGLAAGKYLAFIDDDAKLSPDWAAELVKTYRDKNIVGVTGPILPLWEGRSKNWFPPELDWVIGCSRWLESDRIAETRSVLGTNASFRKDALKLAGFYSSGLGARKSEQSEWGVIAEEAELSLRIKQITGKRIVYNPGLIVYHRVADYKLRWGFITQRSYQVGRTRQLIKVLGNGASTEDDILSTEHRLLRRILTGLIPDTFKRIHKNPLTAWRRLSVTLLALFFVAIGYCVHAFSPTDAHHKMLIEQEGVK